MLRPVEVPALRGSPAALQALTGWRPAIPLEDTVVALLDEARSRLAARAATESSRPAGCGWRSSTAEDGEAAQGAAQPAALVLVEGRRQEGVEAGPPLAADLAA